MKFFFLALFQKVVLSGGRLSPSIRTLMQPCKSKESDSSSISQIFQGHIWMQKPCLISWVAFTLGIWMKAQAGLLFKQQNASIWNLQSWLKVQAQPGFILFISQSLWARAALQSCTTLVTPPHTDCVRPKKPLYVQAVLLGHQSVVVSCFTQAVQSHRVVWGRLYLGYFRS